MASRDNPRARVVATLLHDGQIGGAYLPERIGDVEIGILFRPDVVDRIIPPLLRSGAHAWLVLNLSSAPDDGPLDALVVPVARGQVDPAAVLPDFLKELESVLGAVNAFFVGSSGRDWTPANGLDALRLSDLMRQRRVQGMVLHSSTPLFESEGLLQRVSAEANGVETDEHLRKAAQLVLHTLEESGLGGPVTATPGRGGRRLDAKAAANDMIYAVLMALGVREVVPKIVQAYGHVMDEQTRRFLTSAATVAGFFDRFPGQALFDYSIPGAGVAKAIEREINNCMLPHVNRQSGPEARSNEVASVDLGAVTYLLRGKKGYGRDTNRKRIEIDGSQVPERVQQALGRPLYQAILNPTYGKAFVALMQDFPELRNKVSHVEGFPRGEYVELTEHVAFLPSNDIDGSTLGRILRWKQRQTR